MTERGGKREAQDFQDLDLLRSVAADTLLLVAQCRRWQAILGSQRASKTAFRPYTVIS